LDASLYEENWVKIKNMEMAIMHYVKDVNILIELEHQNKLEIYFHVLLS